MANPDLSSIDSKLLAAFTDLKGAQVAYSEACLLLSLQPNGTDRQRAVSNLEAEIKGYEQAISRLEAAKLAKAQGDTTQAAADRIKAAREAAQATAETAPRITAVLERLVEAFDLTIGPALAELESLARERSSLAWAAVVNAVGVEQARRERAALGGLQADAYLTSTLLAAVLRSGLGQVGPTLTPWVTISAPFRNASSPEQSIEGFQRQAQKLDALLLDAIERAISPATSTKE